MKARRSSLRERYCSRPEARASSQHENARLRRKTRRSMPGCAETGFRSAPPRRSRAPGPCRRRGRESGAASGFRTRARQALLPPTGLTGPSRSGSSRSGIAGVASVKTESEAMMPSTWPCICAGHRRGSSVRRRSAASNGGRRRIYVHASKPCHPLQPDPDIVIVAITGGERLVAAPSHHESRATQRSSCRECGNRAFQGPPRRTPAPESVEADESDATDGDPVPRLTHNREGEHRAFDDEGRREEPPARSGSWRGGNPH